MQQVGPKKPVYFQGHLPCSFQALHDRSKHDHKLTRPQPHKQDRKPKQHTLQAPGHAHKRHLLVASKLEFLQAIGLTNGLMIDCLQHLCHILLLSC